MNQIFKNSLVLFLFLFIGSKAIAQKFLTHPVKRGETLESVAKKYNVNQEDILTYNREIREGQDLKPNTILVIPAEGTTKQTVPKNTPTVSTPENPKTPAAKDPKADERKPNGFTSHKVRKKETLYGIAKRYHITEEDIKRYNRELYATQLKKKMVLRIPKYIRIKPSEEANTINEDDFEDYIVAAKETRWSIAHKYGITIDSMIALNPKLAEDASYLAEGASLKMPKKAGSSVQNQVTELFISYTVPPKMNFYQLEKKFGMKSDEIIRLNPEIKERGGLKEGMILRFPEQKVTTGEVNTDNYIFYEVKPKQTEFSLTRKLGISYTELLNLNPDLQNGLKAGMVLKLPKSQIGDFDVRNALVLDKINLLDSINVENKPKLLFILPFRTDKLDSENKANTRRMIQKRTDAKVSLGLYSGALIALDSLAELGISVDVKTIDNQLSPLKTKSFMIGADISEYSAIIGPLDPPSLREVAVRALSHRVPVVAPVPIDTKLSLGNVFFSYTPVSALRKKMLGHLKSKVEKENIIIIADSTNAATRDNILLHFPDAKVVEVIEEEKNIGIDREKLAEMLSEDEENWVIVETDNFRLASSVTSILNSFHNSVIDPEVSLKKVYVKMFSTNKNKAFESDVISGSHLSNLNFTYPSVFKEISNDSFVKRYSKRFGDKPDRYAIRGFDLTYDLVLKLAFKNNLMEVSNMIGETEYAGNKFSYENDSASGYFNQSSYIMSYEKMRIKEVK